MICAMLTDDLIGRVVVHHHCHPKCALDQSGTFSIEVSFLVPSRIRIACLFIPEYHRALGRRISSGRTISGLVIMGTGDRSREFPVKGKDRLLIRVCAGYAASRCNKLRRAASERSRSMSKIRFVGLDVHADIIAVAVAEPGGEVRSRGMIPNREESIRRWVRKLGDVTKLRACYEAGPTGYVLYWHW